METPYIDFETRKVYFADDEIPGKKGEQGIPLAEEALAIPKEVGAEAIRRPGAPPRATAAVGKTASTSDSDG